MQSISVYKSIPIDLYAIPADNQSLMSSIGIYKSVPIATAVVIGTAFTCRMLYNTYSYLTKKYTTVKQNIYNVIIIKDDEQRGPGIDIKTQEDFLNRYKKLDKNKDIHLIINTRGGSLSHAESIANIILNHANNYHGRFIAYIPRYAYSGGCLLALACSKIVMLSTSIIGPCDAQRCYMFSQLSINSIIKSVQYKKTNNQKIDENWLAMEHEATLTLKRQIEFVKKLITIRRISQDTGDKIYDKLFSGKYNHDQGFLAYEIEDLLGGEVEIVDDMPSVVNSNFTIE
jgi:ClpP class serine protease